VSSKPINRGRAIALIGAVQMLQPFALDPYLPSVNVIASGFAVNPSVIQLTLSAVSVGFALGQLITGPLSDSLGRRRPLLTGMAIYLIASILCGFTTSIEMFFAMRFLQGLSAAAVLVVGNAMIRDLYEGLALIKAMSRALLLQAASWFIGPFMGSLFLYFTDWRGISFTIAGLSTLLMLLAWRLLPETLHSEDRNDDFFKGMLHRFGAVLKDREYAGLVGISMSFALAIYAYLSVTPFIYSEEFGIASTSIGLFMGFNSMASYVGVQFSSKLAHYVPAQWVLTAVIGVAMLLGLGMVFIGQTKPPLWLAAGLILLFVFAFGASVTPNSALAMAPHGKEAGTAAALMSVTGYLATAAAGPFYTSLDKTSLSGVGATILGIMMFAMLLMIFVVRPHRVAALKR
jgi:DHA1 family bicyclomycin/chloramphenicol resistance-like MFS transporter